MPAAQLSMWESAQNLLLTPKSVTWGKVPKILR